MKGKYKGKYGKLVVDFKKHKVIDELDREKILKEAKNYHQHVEDELSIIFSIIIDTLLGKNARKIAPPTEEFELWAGGIIPRGYKAVLADGWEFEIDMLGTRFKPPKLKSFVVEDKR